MRRAAGALLLSAACALGCGERERSPVTPGVDGRPIQLAELRRAIRARLEAEPNAAFDQVASEELDRLIDERIAQNRGEELHLEIPPAEVQERIQLVHGEGFALAADPNYTEQVRLEMLGERAAVADLGSQLEVSEEELLQQFESRRAEFDRPERVRIRQIVAPTAAKAAELLQKLKGGADFAELAREHSQAPEGRQGGLLPPFAAGDLPEVFDRAFQLEPGVPSEVIQSPHGYHIFLLVEKIPAQLAEFQAVREEILGQLRRERLEPLRRTWIRGLRRRAQIAVDEHLLEDLR